MNALARFGTLQMTQPHLRSAEITFQNKYLDALWHAVLLSPQKPVLERGWRFKSSLGHHLFGPLRANQNNKISIESVSKSQAHPHRVQSAFSGNKSMQRDWRGTFWHANQNTTNTESSRSECYRSRKISRRETHGSEQERTRATTTNCRGTFANSERGTCGPMARGFFHRRSKY